MLNIVYLRFNCYIDFDLVWNLRQISLSYMLSDYLYVLGIGKTQNDLQNSEMKAVRSWCNVPTTSKLEILGSFFKGTQIWILSFL